MENESYVTFENALERVFGSLLELVLSQGMTIRRVAEIAQMSLLNRLSDNGYSMQQMIELSGLSKKTIHQVLNKSVRGSDQYNKLALFLSCWESDDKFPSCITMDKNRYPNWGDLCKQYGKEMTPAHILKSLLDKRCVEVNNSHVVLKSTVVSFEEFDINAIEYFGFVVENLIKTINNNLLTKGPKLFESSIFSTAIDKEKVDKCRSILNEKLAEFSKELENCLKNHEADDPNLDNNEQLTVGVGLNCWKK